MKSFVVDRDGSLRFAEMPIPAYGDCQALVKMRSCGVCNGTDTKIIHGTFKNFDTYPAVLGHEGVGEVVEVGAKVQNLKIGDLVLLPFLEEEANGIYSGWGAYSEYCVVGDAKVCLQEGRGPGTEGYNEGYEAQTVIRPEDKVDPVSASMVITFREVLSAIKRFGFLPNKKLLVYGAGPVGLCFVRFAKLLGLESVYSADIIPEKLEQAKAMGADVTLNSAAPDFADQVKALCPEGLDYVVDAAGVSKLINLSMGLIKDHGKICCYGISPNLNMELDWSAAPYNWDLQFVQWPSKKEEGEAHSQIMAWINSGVLNPYDFISHVIDFADMKTAFEKIENRDPDIKKMVVKF